MFAASKSGSADAKDANFKNVTMLLHGNGTNGAQNNTFVDSSTNNFSITRNGNTTQGTFSPYGSNWSNYFGGSSDYLTMPDNSNYVISGDFTAEAWIFPTSFGGTNGNIVLAQWPGGTATNQSFQFYVNSTGKVGLVYGISVVNAAVAGTSLSCTLNTWNHIAVTRSGSTVRFFVNGSVDSTTATVAGSFNDSNGVMSVGRINASDSGYFSGYISNCRLVTGTALYTAAFTPTTSPLTAISGTQVLVCQANRFADASSNNATITVGGSPSVQRFSPFNATSAYTTSVIGGSGYFDGTGDYINAVSANTANAMGTGDWTVECWVYKTNSTQGMIFDTLALTGSSTDAIRIYINASNAISFYKYSTPVTTGGSVTLNAWNHVAVVRQSGSIKIYLNGTQVNTTYTDTGSNYTCGANRPSSGIDGYDNSTNPFQGYITDLRAVKGTAVYTSAFTPPTAPLTAITNTSFLANFTNAGILDNAMMNDLETVGNAQISTSVKKFGTGSMYFDGTGDYLMSIANQSLELGSGDYTLECWVNISAAASNGGIISKGPIGNLTNTTWSLEFNGSANTVSYYVYNANNAVYIINGTSNIKTSTWIHLAICRSGNNTRLFVNGTQEGSTNTSNYTISAGDNLYIGGGFYAPTTRTITGYIDELRISKVARYTANFTAPTAPFPDKG